MRLSTLRKGRGSGRRDKPVKVQGNVGVESLDWAGNNVLAQQPAILKGET
jgi:hypothetical protein